MDTPASSPPSSDIDEGIMEGERDNGSVLGNRSSFAQEVGGDRGQRTGAGDRGGPRRSQLGGQGKKQMEIIDQEMAQRWNIEIGDILADIATSKVILPGPLPVSTTTPQAPTTGPQEAMATSQPQDAPQETSEQPAQQ